MQLANLLPRLHTGGGDLAAVVVDPPGRNAALADRWKLPFPIWSDPDGRRWLEPLDLWNAEERGGIGWPALVLFDAEGREAWRSRSRDFADRPPGYEDLLGALDGLGLPPIEPPPSWKFDVERIEDPAALRPDAFGPMFRGIRFATIGLAGRLETEADRGEARRMGAMAQSFLDAWKIRRESAA